MAIKYFCDRCGKEIRKHAQPFTVTVKPPEVWAYSDPMAEYYEGDLLFCSDCMKKIIECIEELGRKE